MTYSTSCVPTTPMQQQQPDADSHCFGQSFQEWMDLSRKPLTPQSCSYGLISDVVLSSSPIDDDCIVVWPPCDFKDKDLLDKYDSIDWVRTNHSVYDHQSQELFTVMRHTLETLNVIYKHQFPELRPGSIYFADDEYQWQHNFGGHDMGIHDYEEDSIIDKIESISPDHSWFIPDVDAPDVDADF
ncbi:hypothetical protein RDI58_030580 [Solanum bulbocastanum]|uniref:Uncharacterized protein n=1 Tax=Solanum bulbocastanum TaxID=147425 RepID=A0AAN8SU14_SOLBU